MLGRILAPIQKLRVLTIASIMIFFWAIFDGAVMFISPLIITYSGYSVGITGLIIGASSIAGAFFDLVLSKIIRSPHYRQIYISMFVICFLTPLFLLWGNDLVAFLIAMALWGLYFDLQNFATLDFITRVSTEEERTSNLSALNIYRSLGYLVSTLFFILIFTGERATKHDFVQLLGPAIVISFIFFLLVWVVGSNISENPDLHKISKSVSKQSRFAEFRIWRKITKATRGPLMLIMTYNIFNTFIWTIGPLLVDKFSQVNPESKFLMVLYTLAPLIIGWFVGQLAKKYGKRNLSYKSMLLASLVLLPLGFISNIYLVLALITLCAIFMGIASPAINTVFIDLISNDSKDEQQIEAVHDLFTNIGCVLGPIFAGLAAGYAGEVQSFALLGCIGLIMSIGLIKRARGERIDKNNNAIEFKTTVR